MQSRFTAKGLTKDDKEVLLAYELKEDEFRVDLHIIPTKSLSIEDKEKLEKGWVDGEAFTFPEDAQFVNPNLNSESILPEDIRSEETGKIRAKQNEWAYTLLTAKLWESYLHELDELKKKAAELIQYDRKLFDDAKSFWERVLEHRKERDISQDRLDKIKDEVNSVFEKLKTFRKTESAEFEAASAKLRDAIAAKLEDVKKRADAKANFKALVDELKAVQGESKRNRYTKGDDNLLKKAFDAAFHYVTEQRNHFFSNKNATRVKGLTDVIERMEISLNRDKKDLEYMLKKAAGNSIKSLELQLVKVKTNMLNETIASKEEKLKDIRATLEKLLKQDQKLHKKEDGAKQPAADSTAATPAPEDTAETTSVEDATSEQAEGKE